MSEASRFHMVDVGPKPATRRVAVASGEIELGPEAFARIRDRTLPKGDALAEWKKLDIDDQRLAYRGARHYAMACDAGHQGAMDAFRWLRAKRWSDWQDPPAPTSPAARAGASRAAERDAEIERYRQSRERAHGEPSQALRSLPGGGAG